MALENSWPEPATALGGGGGDGGDGGHASSLKSRIWITLGILIVYRIGTYVPLPNVDPAAFHELLLQRKFEADGIMYMFAPGPLGRLSVFALSVVPYLLAVILMQVAATISPSLKALRQQGTAGQDKMRRYVNFTALPICISLAYGLSLGLEKSGFPGFSLVSDAGPVFHLTTIVTVTAGTMFLIWLAGQITRHGVGDGIALIVFASIVANLPRAIVPVLELGRIGALSDIFILLVFVAALALTTLIVCAERARRKLIVVYSKCQSGTRLFGGSMSRLSLKPNVSGIAAPVLASALLAVPLTVANFPGGVARGEWLGEMTGRAATGHPLFLAIYGGLIATFAILCSRTLFDPTDVAHSLKQHAGYLPGIRPGKNTAEHLKFIQTRISAAGTAYLVLICLLPDVLISYYEIPLHFSGASLFIIAVVGTDILRRIRDDPSASSS